MARKDLLKGLMSDDAEKVSSSAETESKSSIPTPNPTPARPTPRYSKGAIGAVSQSIAELKSRALVELTADQIDDGGLKDRLDEDPQAHAQLVASIRDYGQQVPVLVRHDPNFEGRYQVVYGRRRVAALKELNQPVKAMIRDLSDQELVLAQGQENTARKDLSFIEKANFARQMRNAGYERKVIIDALHVDKTVISRMLSISDAIEAELIEAIGPAPAIGRDRWAELARRLSRGEITHSQAVSKAKAARELPSDKRFEAVTAKASAPKRQAKPTAPEPLKTEDGINLGTLKRSKTGLSLSFTNANGFDEWLAENIDRIHRDWKSSGE